MRTLAVLVVGAALMGSPVFAAESVTARWMGEKSFSCGQWPKGVDYHTPDKAFMLNWVLGFLSGVGTSPTSPDLLANTDNASIAAWIDNYCAANPLDTMLVAATKLRWELDRRERPAPRK